MAIQQEISKRYIDKEKLGNFWRTHPDFQGHPCVLEVNFSRIIFPERRMTRLLGEGRLIFDYCSS